MKPLLLIALATVAFAGTESTATRKEIHSVEGSMNGKFRTADADPYYLLGTARGTYLQGYGAVFTTEMEIVFVTPPSLFRNPYNASELATIRARQLKKLPVLKQAMRELMATASSQLDSVPLSENIAVETFLFHYSWEDTHGLPQRILMTASRDKLLKAQASHTDLSTVIEEQEL